MWDFKNPDFAKTRKVEALKDDFLVLKLTDDTNDTCILKGEVVSKTAALEHLAHYVASGVVGKNLEVANVTQFWTFIQQAINRCLGQADPLKATKAITALKNAYEKGHLSIMSVAPGEVTSSRVGESTGHSKTLLLLLNQPTYLEDLGRLAALDVYTCQIDRVFSGNLGNWMTEFKFEFNNDYYDPQNSKSRVSALIDNTDRAGNVAYFLSSGEPLNPFESLSQTVTTHTIYSQADSWALQTAIHAIFTIGLVEKGEITGVFPAKLNATDWLKRASSQDSTKTNSQYYYDYMQRGWDDAVKKLKNNASQDKKHTLLGNRIKQGGEDVPQFLIARLMLRDRYFLGL
jgi:hypothetical protein